MLTWKSKLFRDFIQDEPVYLYELDDDLTEKEEIEMAMYEKQVLELHGVRTDH